jgi:O-methyltransferase involved in polyketide biosynthesis
VLNLAAGFDTRFYRLRLPSRLRWVEVDAVEVLAHKAEVLARAEPQCTLERVPLDLADRSARSALFGRLGQGSPRTLVISEGLVIYLSPAEVAGLACDLHAEAAFGLWLTDVGSPRALRRQQRAWGKQLAQARAPMRFGPSEGPDFFRPHGFQPREVRSGLLEAGRLGREMAPPPRWLVRLALHYGPESRREQTRRMVSYVLLERSDPTR